MAVRKCNHIESLQKTSTHGDTLILNYAIADVLQSKMQSKSKSKKKLSDLQKKYVEWIRQMDKITQSR
jgi:CobQ-like glutamine amidotransferase family enzyme